MDKPEILEMPNFEYTQQGFIELQAALKAAQRAISNRPYTSQ